MVALEQLNQPLSLECLYPAWPRLTNKAKMLTPVSTTARYFDTTVPILTGQRVTYRMVTAGYMFTNKTFPGCLTANYNYTSSVIEPASATTPAGGYCSFPSQLGTRDVGRCRHALGRFAHAACVSLETRDVIRTSSSIRKQGRCHTTY